MTLDIKLSDFKEIMIEAIEAALDYHASSDERPVIGTLDATALRQQLEEPLPEAATDMRILIEDIKDRIFPNTSLTSGPRYHAYVGSGGTFAGVMAETIAAMLNQNGARWHLSPISVEIEKLVVRWLSSFIGYREDAGGIFVSGGSMANQVCLTIARSAMAPWDVKQKGIAGHPPMAVYASDQVHSCIHKSVAVLGIGIENLRILPSTPKGTLDPSSLEERIKADRKDGMLPFCVVATAGTVNTGAVDPLDAIADVCERQSCWLHVDGAFGGVAASLPKERHQFTGLERADSIALVPHKWLYVPVEDGVALVRSVKEIEQVYSVVPDYLRSGRVEDRYEPNEHSFELSRSFKSFKVWATFKAYGAEGLRTAIQGNIDDVRACAEEIESRPSLELYSKPTLSAVCFRYRGPDESKSGDDEYLDDLNARLVAEIEKDGRIFLAGTRLDGRQVLRICNVNHRTKKEHLFSALDVIEDIGAQIAK